MSSAELAVLLPASCPSHQKNQRVENESRVVEALIEVLNETVSDLSKPCSDWEGLKPHLETEQLLLWPESAFRSTKSLRCKTRCLRKELKQTKINNVSTLSSRHLYVYMSVKNSFWCCLCKRWYLSCVGGRVSAQGELWLQRSSSERGHYKNTHVREKQGTQHIKRQSYT